MSTAWFLARGASPREGGVQFRVWAPASRRVDVVIHAGDARTTHALEPEGGGVFGGTVAGTGAGTRYAYRLDGGAERADPLSRWQPDGVHGSSAVVDPAFDWTDEAWRGIELDDLVLYELHVGTFTARGTFEAAIDRLSDLRALGVTAIELMPIAEFPGGRNWGYDGVHAYAPQSTYGGPVGLKKLVDAAHREGLAVLLDVVYNHLGPEGNFLGEFGPYFTDRYATPWGRAINFDGPGSDDVRRWAIDNALYWVDEFHIDGLRLDAVHEIYDMTAVHVLEELAERVHALAQRAGRRVHVIAESSLNDPRLVRERRRGGYGLDAQWNDCFHHAVHARLTGETDGYYCDFGGTAHIAKVLRDRFVFDGVRSEFRDRRHGAPATDVPRERFVVAIQNHDQVGNRARGERLSTLLDARALRLAAALLLLAPYPPMLFMGEEYGETNPFLYFVSHGDPDLVEAVRRGRTEEFASFGWTGDVPDPQAESSFERSKLSWNAEAPERAGLRALYAELLRLRAQHAALRAAAPADVDAGADWIALHRGEEWLALFRFDGSDASQAAVPAGAWERVLATDEARFGGQDGAPAELSGGTAALPTNVAALYRRRTG